MVVKTFQEAYIGVFNSLGHNVSESTYGSIYSLCRVAKGVYIIPHVVIMCICPLLVHFTQCNVFGIIASG